MAATLVLRLNFTRQVTSPKNCQASTPKAQTETVVPKMFSFHVIMFSEHMPKAHIETVVPKIRFHVRMFSEHMPKAHTETVVLNMLRFHLIMFSEHVPKMPDTEDR